MAQRHMDRLSSFDTSFLANEKGNAHMAIGAVLMFAGPAPSQDEFLAQIRSRLHQLPRLRQRLLTPPLGLGTPFWVDDECFDVRRHVDRATLPAPGADAEPAPPAGGATGPAPRPRQAALGADPGRRLLRRALRDRLQDPPR